MQWKWMHACRGNWRSVRRFGYGPLNKGIGSGVEGAAGLRGSGRYVLKSRPFINILEFVNMQTNNRSLINYIRMQTNQMQFVPLLSTDRIDQQALSPLGVSSLCSFRCSFSAVCFVNPFSDKRKYMHV